jgi:hypothetical protein
MKKLYIKILILVFAFSYVNATYAQTSNNENLIDLEVPQILKSKEEFSIAKNNSYKIEVLFFKEINNYVTITLDSIGDVVRIQIPDTVPSSLLKNQQPIKGNDPCVDFCGLNRLCLIGCYLFVSKGDKE